MLIMFVLDIYWLVYVLFFKIICFVVIHYAIRCSFLVNPKAQVLWRILTIQRLFVSLTITSIHFPEYGLRKKWTHYSYGFESTNSLALVQYFGNMQKPNIILSFLVLDAIGNDWINQNQNRENCLLQNLFSFPFLTQV